jgi:uncharacterized membrane protein
MESKKRTIIKAISYRALVTSILAMISWTFTSNAEQTTLISVIYAVLATIGYYGHERLWNRISWGTKRRATATGLQTASSGKS